MIKFQQRLRATRKKCGLVPMAIFSAVFIAGCQSLQPSRRSAGLPSLPSQPPAGASLTGERTVLFNQIHQMAQQDAGNVGR